MNSTALLSNLFALVCSCSLSAQFVWPVGYGPTSGGSEKATPFSISSGLTPNRTRSVIAIDGGSLPFGQNQVIHGIAFRRDGIDPSSYAGFTANVQVRIATVPDAETLTAAAHLVFQQVHQVFQGNVAIPPAAPPTAPTPAPFQLAIPFTTNWTYPGGDFAIEITVTAPAGSRWRCDAVELPAVDGGIALGIGGGCPTSAGDVPAMRVKDLRSVRPGGAITYVVDRMVPPPLGAFVFFSFGVQSPGYWLPGLPASCRIYLAPIITSGLGLYGNRMVNYVQGEYGISLPPAAGLAGVHITSQAGFFDFGLTSQLPVGLSQGLDLELGPMLPPGTTFVGRTQWIYGAKAPGSTQGLQLGAVNHVPIVQFL